MKFLGRYNLIVYSLFIGLLFIFYKGYQFNSGDQAECLPQIYQLHNPGLYPTDFFMQEYNKVFTVRHYFVYFVYGLSLLIPLNVLAFLLTLLTIVLDIFFVTKITQKLTDNKLAHLLSPLLVFFLFHSYVAGGNTLQDTSLIPGTLTMPFSLAGIWLFIDKRYKLSFFLLGIGTLFQPLAALQVFGIFWLLLLFDKNTKDFNTITLSTLLYLLPALCILGPVFYRQFGLQMDYDMELYYNLLYRFRNHLHYIPSFFPVKDYIKLFSLIVLGFAATRLIPINKKKQIYHFSIVILLGMLLYWLCLEVLEINAVGKIQWFKNSMWLNMFASMVISIFIAEKLQVFTPTFEWKKWHSPMLLVCSLVLLVAILNGKYLPHEKLQSRYHIGNYKKTDLTLMHEWIEDNLPLDATILCSPQNTSFACEAKRNQVIQYQAIIHEPFYMLPWYQRFSDIYGISIKSATMKDIRQQATEQYQFQQYAGYKYPIHYRIDNLKKCSFVDQLGPVVYQSGDYILTKHIPKQ